MADKRVGWEVFCGVSCTTIQNGMYSKEYGPTADGGDGTLVPDIEAFVPELVPQSDGTNPEQKIIQDIKLRNPFTKTDETTQVVATHILRCKYMGIQNFYVPCVHRGEQVWVLRHEGSEFQYYWLPMGRDEGIRNFEHIRWYAHNMPTAIQKIDENHGIKTTVTDDNCYFIDINTQRDKTGGISTKMIQIHTSQSDGEEYAYDIRIYPGLGKLEICDNATSVEGGGNRIELDSRETKWTIRNIDDSFIKLDKENIFLSCRDTINLTAGKKIRVRSGWADDYVTNNEVEVAGNAGALDTKYGTHSEVGQLKTESLAASKTVTTPATTETTSTIHTGNVVVNGNGVITRLNVLEPSH